MLARTDEEGGPRGFTLFLVDKARLAPGTFTHLPKVPTYGIRGADISGISFAGAHLPEDALVGAVGQGVEIIVKALHITRTCCAAMSLGAGDHALRLAADFAATHGTATHGATPLARRPHVRRELGEATAGLLLAEATGLIAVRSLHALTGEMSVISAVAKAYVPAQVDALVARLLHLLGPHGLLGPGDPHGHFAKAERDHRIIGIFDGSSLVNRNALVEQFPRRPRLPQGPRRHRGPRRGRLPHRTPRPFRPEGPQAALHGRLLGPGGPPAAVAALRERAAGRAGTWHPSSPWPSGSSTPPTGSTRPWRPCGSPPGRPGRSLRARRALRTLLRRRRRPAPLAARHGHRRRRHHLAARLPRQGPHRPRRARRRDRDRRPRRTRRPAPRRPAPRLRLAARPPGGERPVITATPADTVEEVLGDPYDDTNPHGFRALLDASEGRGRPGGAAPGGCPTATRNPSCTPCAPSTAAHPPARRNPRPGRPPPPSPARASAPSTPPSGSPCATCGAVTSTEPRRSSCPPCGALLAGAHADLLLCDALTTLAVRGAEPLPGRPGTLARAATALAPGPSRAPWTASRS